MFLRIHTISETNNCKLIDTLTTINDNYVNKKVPQLNNLEDFFYGGKKDIGLPFGLPLDKLKFKTTQSY